MCVYAHSWALRFFLPRFLRGCVIFRWNCFFHLIKYKSRLPHDSCICTLQSIKCSVVSPDQELFVSYPDPDKNERNTDTKSKFYFCCRILSTLLSMSFWPRLKMTNFFTCCFHFMVEVIYSFISEGWFIEIFGESGSRLEVHPWGNFQTSDI